MLRSPLVRFLSPIELSRAQVTQETDLGLISFGEESQLHCCGHPSPLVHTLQNSAEKYRGSRVRDSFTSHRFINSFKERYI